MSIVGGSSNNVYAIDNDTGYVVWQRHFDATIPAATPGCPAGMTAAATRIVPLVPPPITVPPPGGGGRAAQAYRSVIGEPGQGVPLETRGGGPGRGPAAPGAANPAGAAPGAAGPQRQGGDPAGRGAAPPPAGGGRGNAGPPIPGAPPVSAGGLGRPSGVVYAISSDGVLHVMGLQSGKDIQRPAEFFPANARWSDAIAVNTTLYTSTSGNCAGTPNGVWGIDLESDAKPVVSWKSKDDLVGTLAFTSDGTVVVAKTNGIVMLDGKTLQEKEFVFHERRRDGDRPDCVPPSRQGDRRGRDEGWTDRPSRRRGVQRRQSCDSGVPVESDRDRRIYRRLAGDLAGDDNRAGARAARCITDGHPTPGTAGTGRTRQHHARHALDPRARHGWDGCAEADGIERRPGARTGLDGARLHGAGDADRGQRRRVRSVDGTPCRRGRRRRARGYCARSKERPARCSGTAAAR